jgi:hypothetical protein
VILKYKLDNGAWRFISLSDFTSCKVDTTELYNSYIDDTRDKLKFDYCSCINDEAYFQFEQLFKKAAYYNLVESNFNLIMINENIINKYTHYLVVSFNYIYDYILYDEAYLMSDEGKTIEKLM